MSFELTVEKLVYGGEALAHHQGRTVLVPRVLPGELVEVEETHTAKGVTRARPLRVIQPSPERVEPPCKYFGNCGGCQYQHLGDNRQAELKREILRETLRRIGKINWEKDIPVHTAASWNYRNQAQFKLTKSEGGVAIGFYEAESHHLVAIDECMILSPRLNEALRALRDEVLQAEMLSCREIELLADDGDERVMITLHGDIPPAGAEKLARGLMAPLPGASSVAVRRNGRFEIFGEPALSYRVGDFSYRISPGSFFQASRHLLPELVSAVTDGVSGALALDLFAGVGLFTLPLARAFRKVVGVEANPGAASDLAANARANRLDNVRASGENAYDFLRRFARPAADLAVLDPPRAGVGARSLELLIKLGPARIHYVSCHPPTLARDLGHLTQLGYTVISIAMFDFFPHTSHIECLAQLTKSGRAGS
jgi:23S rRNA (uracil1939-C5)-methyltransferase